MSSPDTIYVAVTDPTTVLTGKFLGDYAAALFVLILVVLGLLSTHLRPVGAPPVPFSAIITHATEDGIPSLLAIGLTGTIIALAVTRIPIPQFLTQAFLIVIGYYFGQQIRKSRTPSDEGTSHQTKKPDPA